MTANSNTAHGTPLRPVVVLVDEAHQLMSNADGSVAGDAGVAALAELIRAGLAAARLRDAAGGRNSNPNPTDRKETCGA